MYCKKEKKFAVRDLFFKQNKCYSTTSMRYYNSQYKKKTTTVDRHHIHSIDSGKRNDPYPGWMA